jgi:glycerol-3-phosphate dehydrogenase
LIVAGGKWTTYRRIAEDVVDFAIKEFKLTPTRKCRTRTEKLIGSEEYSDTLFIEIAVKYNLSKEISQHLAKSYGTEAWKVLEINSSKLLHQRHPYLESEILYSIRNEYALDCVDVLARRMRLAFLDTEVTLEVLPKVFKIH